MKPDSISRRNSSLDRVLGRLEELDASNLTVVAQRLMRDRGLLEMVFDTIEEGIFVINTSGIIDYANSAGMNLIGLSAKELGNAILWKNVPELISLSNVIGDDTISPHITRDFEISYPEKRWLRMQLSRLGMSGELSHFVLILHDITSERQNTEERVENERVNSIFVLAASVAHEIGNPLNSMMIHLNLIKKRLAKCDTKSTKEGKSIENSVEICQSEIRRLDDILKNFLGAIRPQKPVFSKLNLIELVMEVLAVQKLELENRNIYCSVKQGKEMPIVLGDYSQLKQVVFNVIKNSMESMQDGGNLKIYTETNEDFVSLKIRDNGCGIEHDKLSKIYEPFFTTKSGGHGLGMMIVMRIMREHKGQISIESEVGNGTCVSLDFPKIDKPSPLLKTDE